MTNGALQEMSKLLQIFFINYIKLKRIKKAKLIDKKTLSIQKRLKYKRAIIFA